MAHLWMRDPEGAWAPTSLDGDPFTLAGGFTFQPVGDAWILVFPFDTPVSVNGMPCATGLRALADRDALRIPGRGPVFFSTESPPTITPFPEEGEACDCPRCQQPLEPATPAVRCPRCNVWHHQDMEGEFPCWTYATTCAICDQPTELDAGYRWSPEGL